MFIFLWLAYFTWHNILKAHSYCSILQKSLPLWGWKIFHCVYIPHFAYLFTGDGHLNFFHILAVVNDTAVYMDINLFLWDSAFISFGYVPKCGITRSYANSTFNFLKYLHSVFHSLPFAFPATLHMAIISPLHHQNVVIVVLDCSHLNEHAMASHCSFYLCFLNDYWSWSPFQVLIDLLYSFFREISVKLFCPFLNQVVCF